MKTQRTPREYLEYWNKQLEELENSWNTLKEAPISPLVKDFLFEVLEREATKIHRKIEFHRKQAMKGA